MNIADNGSWLNETNEGHCFDEGLCKAIVEFCKDNELKEVVDLGCGDGSYVKYFNENSDNIFAFGCDGNPNTHNYSSACFTVKLHRPLTAELRPFNLVNGKIDLILSLEVGEHIPAEYEDVFLDNVVKYAKDWIILSWAIPGQGGDGHVNCRDNQWVMLQMYKRRFLLNNPTSKSLRDQATLPWFKDSLMVFKRIAEKG